MGELSEVQKAKLKEQEAGAAGAPVLIDTTGPITAGAQATPRPRPNRTQFPAGMEGDAAFQKAKKKWQEGAQDSVTGAQKSALAP